MSIHELEFPGPLPGILPGFSSPPGLSGFAALGQCGQGSESLRDLKESMSVGQAAMEGLTGSLPQLGLSLEVLEQAPKTCIPGIIFTVGLPRSKDLGALAAAE